MSVLTFIFLMCSLCPLLAQSPVGVWKTIHEKTGEVKSLVEIFEQNGQYYGRILAVMDQDYISACKACPGAKHNQPIENLIIIEKVKPTTSPLKWKGGTVLDPKSGRTFKFSMWFEKGRTDRLKVRGTHWSGMYRTQTWERADRSAYTVD